MQIIDTFSGIGGFSLAGQWMGWRTIQFCEIDKFCQQVLKYHWPDVPLHDDIKTLTAQQIFNNGLYDKKEPTILVGGVPCQPWSAAGKRRGTEDDRNLWPHSIELVKSLATDYIVFENVFGFVNWSGGMVFREVISDLENEGYEVQPFIIPACAVNAPHRRDRVWIVAHAKDLRDRRNAGAMGETQIKSFRKNDESEFNCKSQDEPTPDTDRSERCERRMHKEGRKETERYAGTRNAQRIGNWQDFPTEPPLRSRDDGVLGGLDGITFSKLRNESIKAYGNAVVPQVVFEIFKAIEKYELLKTKLATEG